MVFKVSVNKNPSKKGVFSEERFLNTELRIYFQYIFLFKKIVRIVHDFIRRNFSYFEVYRNWLYSLQRHRGYGFNSLNSTCLIVLLNLVS